MTSHPGDHQINELKILIADDMQENIELLREYFSEYGYTIITAQNGNEALERLNSEDVHLIIADAMMPKMDGFQLCRKVKENPKYANVPFFIYTGDYIDKEDREFARSIGVDKYVVKTEGLDELVDAVNDVAQQWYGYRTQNRHESQHTIDDSSFLEKHHEILIKKLEEKMRRLEQYADTLNLKNLELKESEERYRSLFENANIGIVILDRASKKIIDANNQALKLFKYAKGELLAMDILPIERDNHLTPELLYTELFFSGEASIIDKTDARIDVHISSVPINHAKDPRIIVYIRDISEQNRIHQKLLQVENMTLMGRLAAGIAHEIRNPLAAVTVNLQYLLRRYADNEDIIGTVSMGMEGAKRVEQVIDKTLSLARATPPQTKPADVNEILDRVLWFMKMLLKQKKLTVQKDLAADLPAISVDEKQIQQVLLNILQNAVDASHEEGTIAMRTYRGDQEAAGKVCIEVRDFGAGIPEKMKEHMFEPFNTTKKGGTGLGLALSKYIMDRHNADIQVASDTGAGTIIRLQFPVNRTANGE
jgi:two-component system, cell cycle sensor histidine kinase and response regulator CckA